MSHILIKNLANQRLTEMPAAIAAAVEAVMLDDGYLEANIYNPFSDLDPDFQWLREDYIEQAMDMLTNAA